MLREQNTTSCVCRLLNTDPNITLFNVHINPGIGASIIEYISQMRMAGQQSERPEIEIRTYPELTIWDTSLHF